MDIAFVLGNGQSRSGISPGNLRQHGFIYGCNALYRDYIPDVLVATDRPIAMQIEQSGYALKNKFYTRRPEVGLGALTIPKPYFGFSSGPVATALAAMDNYKKIYMLGFDLGATENNKFNNVYAGTEYYKDIGSNPTYTGNWVRQIQQICRDFPEVRFVRVCGKTTARLPELDGIRNMNHLSLQAFVERINNVEDL